MLPFDVKVDVPLSALCEHGAPGMMGHRVKIIQFGRKKERRQICAKCKRELVHEPKVGSYVTPYTIQEIPW